MFRLHGHAEIHYGTYVFYADEVSYDSASGQITADGHVALDGGPNDEHITADHAAYNIRSEKGEFENVNGTIGFRSIKGKLVLTSSNPFVFRGKKVEKAGPDHYIVHNGSITTCELPHPKWQFSAGKVIVDAGGNAVIHHSVFRVHGIPVLYLPYMSYPISRPRQSGFLLPNIGRSNAKGTIVGESLYWAISRSMDAKIGAEYYSKRGWAPQGEFRARPTENSYVDLNYFAVLDHGLCTGGGSPCTQRLDQGGGNVRLDAAGAFPHNIRAVANIDYLSSFVFRLAFNEIFSQAVYSEVKSQAFLSNTTRNFFSNLSVQRYQNFESTNNGDVVTIVHAPSVEFSTVERKLGNSPFYWSYGAAAEGLSRSEPTFHTADLVGRVDLNPSLSLPLVFRGWSLRPEFRLHDTLYTQELLPASGVGVAVDNVVNRKALQGAVELRPPALHRVFDREVWGRKWKHVIEPRATYNYVTGVNNFSNILRFDSRDILSNTNEVEYALVNRLYAKRTGNGPEDCGPEGIPLLLAGAPHRQGRAPWEEQEEPETGPCQSTPQVREIVTWELAQKYYLDPTFGGALVPGRRNVLAATADLTGIAFLTDGRHLSPLVSRLHVQTSARTDAEWQLDYDFRGGRITGSTALVNYRLGQFTLGGGDAFVRGLGSGTEPLATLAPSFNQFRLLFGYGSPHKRGFSGAVNVGFDADLRVLQYTAVQTTYNWDCCGVNLEYRRFSLGSVRQENQFRFTFALTNIGAFGNLRRQERLY